MSANESELQRQEMIDPRYEDFQAIIEELPCGPESPVERYGFDNATKFINYVKNELELGEEDVSRVLEEYEHAKCPYCEVSNDDVDPTLDLVTQILEEDAEHRRDVDLVRREVRDLHCDTHLEAYIEVEFTSYE